MYFLFFCSSILLSLWCWNCLFFIIFFLAASNNLIFNQNQILEISNPKSSKWFAWYILIKWDVEFSENQVIFVHPEKNPILCWHLVQFRHSSSKFDFSWESLEQDPTGAALATFLLKSLLCQHLEILRSVKSEQKCPREFCWMWLMMMLRWRARWLETFLSDCSIENKMSDWQDTPDTPRALITTLHCHPPRWLLTSPSYLTDKTSRY